MSHAQADHHAALKNADGSWKYTNALAQETSPYLLQHAHNPVEWHAWNDATFELARQRNKPIFLSIGYSTCYWCHVMERQSFENPAIAAVMNEHFINIKVDREERPDVDDIYMTAVQVMTGHGGWPMSVFLTAPGANGPDDRGLKPYYAGTYFPPEPSRGMPGFPQLLESLAEAYTSKRDDVLKQSEQIAHAVENHLGHRDTSGEVTVDLVQRVASQLVRNFDTEHGGFGGAPKFPQPGNLALLLAVHRNNPNAQLWRAIEHTLDRMARGGMYDQIGGGFHRYSTDGEWLVPHFEKMLYDNGQLLELYVDAHAMQPPQGDPTQYERVARETAEYVLREMTDSTGAFWSAQDAEVDAMEGGNYVWLPEQIDAAIDDAKLAALAKSLYGLDRGTNFRDPHLPDATPVNVLFQPVALPAFAEANDMSLGEAIEARRAIDAQLLKVRDTRKQPGTDDKVLVSWNGLMIAGMARAGQAFNEPRYIEAASRAANAILQHMQVPAEQGGGLYRSMRAGQVKIPAFLDDYAAFVHGLLALHSATKNTFFLDEAKRLTAIARDRFAAPDGGYFDTLEGQADLFVRTRSTYDGAVPAGNSMMVNNLVALYEATEDRECLQQAVDDLNSFGQVMRQQGMGMVNMHRALLRALELLPASGVVDDLAKPGDKARRDVLTVAVDPHEVELGDEAVTLTVELRIGAEYHLNGPDADAEGLIPTRIELRDAAGIDWQVEYPATASRRYPYADEPLEVFDGTVTAKLTLRRTGAVSGKPVLVLKYQMCTEMSCLEPREADLPVEIR